MKNSEYWQERFKLLEEAQNRLAKASFTEIEAQYRAAMKELEGKINTWYQRLAKNNNISMAEARKLLNANELEEFKWSVWDYIKHGKENSLSGQWVKQLENASAKFHISKYQALMIDTQQTFEQMFGKQLNTVKKMLGKVYENGYYKTAYELQKGFNTGFNVGKINEEELKKVLSKPWAVDGKNFSERIWNNKEKLINEVHTQLTQNIITGADPQKAIDAIAKKMNTSKSNAGRLVMTEEAYFSSAAEGKSYTDLGVEKYDILATLDSLTSEICQGLDGKSFDMKDYEPGITAPPFHVNCRSTTVPHLDEELWGTGEGKRAARGKDGKTYYVSDDITYTEWKKKYVDGDMEYEDKDSKEAADRGQKVTADFWKAAEKKNRGVKGVDKSRGSGIIEKKEDGMAGTDVHYVGKIDREIYKCVSGDIQTDDVIITETQIAHIKERHPNDFEQYFKYAEQIINDPDYIIEANKPNTAFVLKRIVETDKNYQLILRLRTSSDPQTYSNSIITFLKIDNKKWDKYLRNKKILYDKDKFVDKQE